MQNTMLDSTVSYNSQELFNFNAKHNGEACIESLRPEDRGTERQFWFTVAMMCVIFECSADTIRRRVETLVNTGDIDETQNCVSLTNVQAFGYNTTTLYNLNVQIVWACFLRRCKKVVDVQSHSDYIVPCTTHQAHDGLRSCWHP